MANFPTIGLGQAGQNAFNNKWAGYTPPVAPAPTPTAPTQPIAPKPPTLPTQPAQQGATVIPVTTMGSQQPINIPTQQQPTTAPVTMNYQDQLMQQANADTQNTQVQDYQDKTVMQILDAYNNIAGESAYRAQVTQDSNINGLKQNLQNINNQILTKQAEIQQDDVRLAAGLNNIEKKAIPMEFITGQQQSVQRDAQIARALKMSEIGVLNAQVLAGQGNIELAQKTVDDAVAAKFAPFKEFIDIKQKQLVAVAPLLSKAEAKQAAAQKLKNDLSLRKLDKLESDEKDAQKLAMTAGANGAPPSIVSKMAQAKNLAEAIAIGGQYMSDPLDRSIKAAQLRKLNLDNNANDPNSQQAIINSVVNEKDPSKLVSSFFKSNPKIKTNPDINNAAAVVSSINEFAKPIGGGKIKGYGFLGGGFLPEFASGQNAIKNRADIATIEGKVQQWLSGAALSKGQEKLVKQMIPEGNDTDATVRTKLNNLTNYMLGDIKGRATAQGAQFEYIPVDMFSSESVEPNVKTSIIQATASNYTPTEILEHISVNDANIAEQIKEARNAGWKEEEIIAFLAQ